MNSWWYVGFRPVFAQTARLSREVFGNIPDSGKQLFYVLALIALSVFAHGCFCRIRLWRCGRSKPSSQTAGERLKAWIRNVLFQTRVRGRGIASLAHQCLFFGFVVLLIGTALIAIEHVLADLMGRPATNPVFHKGTYYAIYELVTDTFGLVFLFGVALLCWRRFNRPASLGHQSLDWVVLALLFVIGVTGYAVEGLRIIREQTYQPAYSYVGWGAAATWRFLGVDANTVSTLHFLLWWFHAICSLGFIAAIPYTRLLHFVAGAVNLSVPSQELGHLDLVTLEELEATGSVGTGRLLDMSRQQLVMLDACVSCGRCEEACPAFAAGKPLSPRDVVQDLCGMLERPIDTLLHGDTIDAETLWSCTTCSACVAICPLGVDPLGMIGDMRRYLVGEAELRGTAAISLQKLQRSGNPWGLAAADRTAWTDGLDVPLVTDNPDFEVLYWVGCAAAYDRRTQRVARAVVKCLQAAQVNFAVLGPEERCTGETARRLGDEFLFQELGETNIEALSRYNVKKIVTHCPHCFNSFKQDYPQLGFHVDVVHHAEFLSELVENGSLQISSPAESMSATFHDPCYLARVNGITEAPRNVLQSAMGASSQPIEMGRRGCDTACCGAGGGRMWMDDSVDTRIGNDRIEEAVSTRADTLAVSCPFCLKMFDDGLAAKGAPMEVVDVAELLSQQIATEPE